MIEIHADDQSIRELQRELVEWGKRLRKELAIATNKAAKKTQRSIAKQIVQELAVTQKVVRDKTRVAKKAKATDPMPTAVIVLQQTNRIPLKEFRPRQTKKGVTYKVSKTKGRKTIPGGFIVDAYGGHVYKRPNAARATGKRKKGPSPWGVFVKRGLRIPTIVSAKKELRKQILERVRFLKLKRSGVI